MSVVIILLLTFIVLLSNCVAVICVLELISLVYHVPLTSKLFDIVKSSLGINILPLLLARSSRSAFVLVVVITLPSILISSNCACDPTVKFSAVKLLVAKFVDILKLFANTKLLVIKFCKLVVPFTAKLFVTSTLLLATLISPVPLARSSKSAFVLNVDTILFENKTSPRYEVLSTSTFNHCLLGDPKLSTPSVCGLISWSNFTFKFSISVV